MFKLFLAGLYTSNFDKDGRLYSKCTEYEKWQRDYASNLLESYHYIHKQSYVDRIRKDKVNVFLDSGAFSAWTKGVKVDLPGYCRWVKENDDILLKVDGDLWASVLDAIGDDQKTFENQQAMEKLGVRPLPCFHFGENPKYLEYYVANYTSITIGGLVGKSTNMVQPWLDMIWEKYMIDGAGRPKLRVHGFGLTKPDLMRRWPWFSTDSSSWVQIAAAGGILVLPEARVVSMSAQSPSTKVENQHFTTLTPPIQNAVAQRIRSYGGDPDRLQTEYLSRWSYNIYAYTLLGETIAEEKGSDPKFIPEQLGLF
jgi:hypothetical protein